MGDMLNEKNWSNKQLVQFGVAIAMGASTVTGVILRFEFVETEIQTLVKRVKKHNDRNEIRFQKIEKKLDETK